MRPGRGGHRLELARPSARPGSQLLPPLSLSSRAAHSAKGSIQLTVHPALLPRPLSPALSRPYRPSSASTTRLGPRTSTRRFLALTTRAGARRTWRASSRSEAGDRNLHSRAAARAGGALELAAPAKTLSAARRNSPADLASSSPLPFTSFVHPTAQMKHVAAYLLLVSGGNASPSAADVKSVLEAAGCVLALFHARRAQGAQGPSSSARGMRTRPLGPARTASSSLRRAPSLTLPPLLSPLVPRYSASADEDRLEKLISELSGKDINEVIAEGSKKLASVPSGGAGPAAAAGGASAGAAVEEKKEEKVEEKEESDDDMGCVPPLSLPCACCQRSDELTCPPSLPLLPLSSSTALRPLSLALDTHSFPRQLRPLRR